MQDKIVDHKKIAKNTIFLYMRMFVIMGVTLYTSRVILDKLGANDYGLYNVVGGVVAMLGFLNSTLSSGTSRFLTYALGKNSEVELSKTFSTAFLNHFFLAIIVIIILETVGLWFFYNKLVIPTNRFNAALFVYQISLFTTFVSITQVPYSASIIAHEHMEVYAYVSVFEAVGKLVVVYLLSIINFDKLEIYALLIAVVQVLVALCNRFYCSRNFKECKLKFVYDKSLIKKMAKFSGWDITANIVEMLKLQGVLVLLNLFFQPAIVAAQAVGNQVASAMMQFVGNVRTSVNPEIIKSYASGNIEESKALTLNSATYLFDLILLLGLPLVFLMEPILNIWLVKVPPYTVAFAQMIVLQRIIGNFDSAFYIPMVASGKLRSNSLAALYLGFSQFLLLYILLRIGLGVMWVQYLGIIIMVIFSFFVKPFILYKEQHYRLSDFTNCFGYCLKVLSLSCAISLPFLLLFDKNTLIGFVIILIVTLLAVVSSSIVFLSKTLRAKLFNKLISIFLQKRYSCKSNR